MLDTLDAGHVRMPAMPRLLAFFLFANSLFLQSFLGELQELKDRT
jgi:hypothetical protein